MPRVVDVLAGVAAGVATYVSIQVYRNRNFPPPGCVKADNFPGLLGWIGGYVPHQEGHDAGSYWEEQTEKYPDAKGLYVTFGPYGAVVPTQLEDLLYIGREANAALIKGWDYRLSAGSGFGERGLLFIPDDATHTRSRKTVNAAFGPQCITDIANNLMTTHTNNVLAAVEARRPASCPPGASFAVAADELTREFSLGIIQEAAFRSEFAHKDLGGGKTLVDFTPPITTDTHLDWHQLVPLLSRLPTAAKKRVQESRRVISELLRDVAGTVRSTPVPKKERVLVDYLIDQDLSDADLIDNCMSFMFAGYETSATALSWASYLLGAHPEVQNALYEELREVMSADGIPTIESLKQCKMLDAVIMETLRLLPPVQLTTRITVDDIFLPTGVVVPKGSHLWLVVQIMHQKKSIWGDDALEFRPQRFVEPLTPEQQDAYMPFWVGKRSCIGKEFAMNEMRLFLAGLVRRYEVQWPEGKPRPLRKFFVTVQPEAPVTILLRTRSEQQVAHD